MKTLTTAEAKKFMKNATSVASYYGFVPVLDLYKKIPTNKDRDPLSEKRIEMQSCTSPQKGDKVSEALAYVASHTLMCISCVGEEGESALPRLLYHMETAPEKGGGKTKELLFTLSAYGIGKSVAEAVIVKTMLAILNENGIDDTRVYVNSMGDSDSSVKFAREASLHLKKNAGAIPAHAREALKSDVYHALIFLGEKKHPAYEDAPKPMEFLSDKSRRHFSEFLEYLESTDTPYAIDSRIIGHGSCYRETVFEIRYDDEEARTICRGGRCDELAKILFEKKDANLVGATIQIRFQGMRVPTIVPQRTQKPKTYLIQVGLPARMKTLGVVETLRRARIPLALSLVTDSMHDQLLHANALSIPYATIIGQREVLDGTAIIRNLDTQEQEIVPIASLAEHLKAL